MSKFVCVKCGDVGTEGGAEQSCIVHSTVPVSRRHLLKAESRSNPACSTWALTVGHSVLPQVVEGEMFSPWASGEEGEFSNP